MTNNFIAVTLIVPTILKDFNAAHNLPEAHETTQIKVQRLKYKHFRGLQTVSEQDQMHYAIMKLTGLTEDDLDELDAEDVAEITSIVYSFMEKFMKLAGKMMKAAEVA